MKFKYALTKFYIVTVMIVKKRSLAPIHHGPSFCNHAYSFSLILVDSIPLKIFTRFDKNTTDTIRTEELFYSRNVRCLEEFLQLHWYLCTHLLISPLNAFRDILTELVFRVHLFGVVSLALCIHRLVTYYDNDFCLIWCLWQG